jgi:hypothetical protein
MLLSAPAEEFNRQRELLRARLACLGVQHGGSDGTRGPVAGGYTLREGLASAQPGELAWVSLDRGDWRGPRVAGTVGLFYGASASPAAPARAAGMVNAQGVEFSRLFDARPDAPWGVEPGTQTARRMGATRASVREHGRGEGT